MSDEKQLESLSVIVHKAIDRAICGPKNGDPRREGSPSDRLQYLTDAVVEALNKNHRFSKGVIDSVASVKIPESKSAAIGIWPPEPAFTSWDQYFMGFARHAATKSKDTTRVGAVLVGPEGEVRLTGYNGIPRGVEDLPERRERPAKYEWASHAETNLIAFAARDGIRTKGCTVYTTHQPCAACTRTLIQAGVAKVVYGAGSFGNGSAMPAEMQTAETMFREAGIICEAISE